MEGLEDLVEDVEVAFDSTLGNNSRLFEQVVDDRGGLQGAQSIEVYLDKFAKARRVVVFERLRVSKRFKQRVGVKDLFFNRRFD